MHAIIWVFHICMFVYAQFYTYCRTPEIETADLSQSHASLKLSQFRAYCFFHRNSSTATKNN